MDTLETCISSYLEYCNSQKCLDEKTMKAYRIDLRQFSEQIPIINIAEITSKTLEQYIARLHEQYKPKTAKRKIASVKALFRYLEYQDIIEHNPFSKVLIPCLLYWLLSVIDINHACSKIFICSNLFFFGIVYNFCYLSYDNRTCESSESRSGFPREPYLHAEDIPHTATQPYMCCIFYLH